MSFDPTEPEVLLGAFNALIPGGPGAPHNETLVSLRGFSLPGDVPLQVSGDISDMVTTDDSGFFRVETSINPALPCGDPINVTIVGAGIELTTQAFVDCRDLPPTDSPR